MLPGGRCNISDTGKLAKYIHLAFAKRWCDLKICELRQPVNIFFFVLTMFSKAYCLFGAIAKQKIQVCFAEQKTSDVY